MRWLPGFSAILACLVAASALVLGTEAGAVVFNDGQVHVIDADNSFPLDTVRVQDSLTGEVTTLEAISKT